MNKCAKFKSDPLLLRPLPVTPQKPKEEMTEHEKEMDDMFDILLASPSRSHPAQSPSPSRRESIESPPPPPALAAKLGRRAVPGFEAVCGGSDAASMRVSVQNDIDSPDKIRNKDSPVKAAELSKKKLTFSSTNAANEDRISLSDFSAACSSSTADVATRKPVKSHHQQVVTKIREKFVTKQDGSGPPRGKPKSNNLKGSKAKRVSVIPENVFIETARGVAESGSGTETDQQPETSGVKDKRKRRRTKKAKQVVAAPVTAPAATSSKLKLTASHKSVKAVAGKKSAVKTSSKSLPTKSSAPKKAPTALAKPAALKSKAVKPAKAAVAKTKKSPAKSKSKETSGGGGKRRNMRSASSNARETRAQADWNWANVLLTHPEKIGKKVRAAS